MAAWSDSNLVGHKIPNLSSDLKGDEFITKKIPSNSSVTLILAAKLAFDNVIVSGFRVCGASLGIGKYGLGRWHQQ